MILTKDIIKQAVSPKGGFTKKQLALVGIPWPPVKGWKKKVIGKDFPEETIKLFINPT